MHFKLIISSLSETGAERLPGQEYVFQNERIVHIGRGHPNEVPLDDPQKKIGKMQARIIKVDDHYLLEDLNTKKSTYVNNKCLNPGQTALLQNGDVISIGDYTLRYVSIHENGTHSNPSDSLYVNGNGSSSFADTSLEESDYYAASFEEEQDLYSKYQIAEPVHQQTEPVETPSQYSQPPVHEPEPSPLPPTENDNPFSKIVDYSAQAVEALCILYDSEPAHLRDKQLADAIQSAFAVNGDHPVLNQLSQALGSSLQKQPDVLIQSPHPEPSPPPRVGHDHSTFVVSSLVHLLQRLANIPLEFNKSFVGKSRLINQHVKYLLTSKPTELTNSLLAPDVEESVIKQRLAHIYTALSSLDAHQKGMIEGYHSVAQQALEMALTELDPVYIEKVLGEMQSKKKLFKSVSKDTVLETIKSKAEELRTIDWKVYEQRVYRPIFSQGYLSSIGEKKKKT